MRPVRFYIQRGGILIRLLAAVFVAGLFYSIRHIDLLHQARDGVLSYYHAFLLVFFWLIYKIVTLSWKLVVSRKLFVELSILGLVDTRLQKFIMPWDQIRAIRYIEHNPEEKQKERIEITVHKSAAEHSLSASLQTGFGFSTMDGYVNLTIEKLGFDENFRTMYDEIVAWWQKFR